MARAARTNEETMRACCTEVPLDQNRFTWTWLLPMNSTRSVATFASSLASGSPPSNSVACDEQAAITPSRASIQAGLISRVEVSQASAWPRAPKQQAACATSGSLRGPTFAMQGDRIQIGNDRGGINGWITARSSVA